VGPACRCQCRQTPRPSWLMWAPPYHRCAGYKTHVGLIARLSEAVHEVTGLKPRVLPPRPTFASEPRATAIAKLPRRPVLSSPSYFSCAQLTRALNIPEFAAAVVVVGCLTVFSPCRTSQSLVQASVPFQAVRRRHPPRREPLKADPVAGEPRSRSRCRLPSRLRGWAAARSWPGKATGCHAAVGPPWAARMGSCPGAVVRRGCFSPLAI
jgi:hypothetical protein